MDLLTPLQVMVNFTTITRRPTSFNGGDPVNLIDYRTIPILTVEGNVSISVSLTVEGND